MDEFKQVAILRVHGAWWDKPLKACKAARRAARRILKQKDAQVEPKEPTK